MKAGRKVKDNKGMNEGRKMKMEAEKGKREGRKEGRNDGRKKGRTGPSLS
jgi:hypothetical protein